MNNKIPKYHTILTDVIAKSSIRDWFEQFALFIELHFDEEPVNPNELTEDATAEQIAAYDRAINVLTAYNRKLVAFLCSSVSQQIFSVLKSIIAPRQLLTETFSSLKDALIKHYCPAPTVLSERYNFQKSTQKADETVNEYLSRIREVASKCKFPNFEEQLLNQFIFGLRNQEMKDMLLSKDFEKLTLESAVEKVLIKERSHKEAQEMMNEAATANKLTMGKNKHFKNSSQKKKLPTDPSKKCTKCTLIGHSAENCKTKCHQCKQTGHIKPNCRNKKKQVKNNRQYRSHHTDIGGEGIDEENGCEEENLSNWCCYVDFAESPEGFSTTSDSLLHRSAKCCGADTHEFAMLHNTCAVCEKQDVEWDAPISSVVMDYTVYPFEAIQNSPSCNISVNYNKNFDSKIFENTVKNLDQKNFESTLQNLPKFEPINTVDTRPIVKLKLNGQNFEMEFDSGSSVTVCSKSSLDRSSLTLPLSSVQRYLRVASGEVKQILGQALVNVNWQGKIFPNMELFVVEGTFPSLLGRSWISKILGPNWFGQLLSLKVPVPDLVKNQTQCSAGKHERVCSSLSSERVCSSLSSEGVCSSLSSEGDLVKNQTQCSAGKHESVSHGSFGTDRILNMQTEQDTIGSLKLSSQKTRSLEELKQSSIFKGGLGLVKNFEARITLKEGAQPKLMKSRPLPYAIRDSVKQELDNMENSGILQKVETSNWAAPIVPVIKGTKVRICGDYTSLNRVLETKQYPIPTVEECFNRVAGGQKFTVIDISKAYNNVLIRNENRALTTINTPYGLYQWKRLPYGISSSAAIFQELMDTTLEHIPMTICRIDDILVSGRNEAEHMQNLNRVISTLEARGFKCNLPKSQFYQDQVIYVGHSISKAGIAPVRSKVEDFARAKVPETLDELVSFLGAINYYRRYLPNLSSLIAPLDKLRRKDVPWQWTKVEQQAFDGLKELLKSDRVLTFYNPKYPLKLDTDASSTGIGAVLSHILPSKEEKPIEYISRTLSTAERNYSQIDREALAIVWAIKKLHIYLYGAKFQLVSDHKPLVHIFGKNKQTISGFSTSRILRWSIFLLNYDFEISYRATQDHSNCDMLSRLPRAVKHSKEEDEVAVTFALNLEDTCIDAETVAKETKKDPVLSKVLVYILDGWPKKLESGGEMIEYWNKRNELSVEIGCITWGSRVVVPTKLRSYVMNLLHSTHIGMVGMKNLARSYVYWPNLNSQIEEVAKCCSSCGQYGNSLPKLTDHPWTRPTGPWQRIHMDFAGAFLGSMWFIVTDAYSKWPEVIRMNHDTTSSAMIRALHQIFARCGVPCVAVSDNGPQFISRELEVFMKQNNIKHILVPTYSPKSNGLVERFVATFKDAMKKMYQQSKNVDRNLSKFLLFYRNCPHSSNGIAPAVLMYNRTLRSGLHFIRPVDKQTVDGLQAGKEQHVLNSSKKDRYFHPNELVWVQLANSKEWTKAKVLTRHGSSNRYDIECNGRVVEKHGDKIKTRYEHDDAQPKVRSVPQTPEHQDLTNRDLKRHVSLENDDSSSPSTSSISPLSTEVSSKAAKSIPAIGRTKTLHKTVTKIPTKNISPNFPNLSVENIPIQAKPANENSITTRKSSRLLNKPAINYKE